MEMKDEVFINLIKAGNYMGWPHGWDKFCSSVLRFPEVVLHAEESHSTSAILHRKKIRVGKCCMVHNFVLFVPAFSQVTAF